mmetsp:Transcript_6391/g.18101  ORF Transcript_6391/g.18101 Transcript_6391/m.18101 type:complete len:212 (-) Transcript_6391:910-1545(-)
MRWPHHSCRLMHQSRMFSSHLNHVALNSGGMISSLPSRAAAQPSAAICWQLTHHWGFRMGSMTSLEREHRPSRMGLSALPLSRPLASRNLVISTRHWNLGIPANCPVPLPLMRPMSSRMLILSSLCLWPVAKSLGSCAGVIFTAPVPKLMSTRTASVMMGIFRPFTGCLTCLPCRWAYLGSSGWTATAVSPSMVSIRVVATTISPSPSSRG